jgi:uncharacterized radical SAM protein YgiQ
MVYTSRLKEAYREVPVIIGGIEASLRRFAHYDFWEGKVRRSIIFDAKADLLIYGMAERALLEVVGRLNAGEQIKDICTVRGTCRVAGKDKWAGSILPGEKEDVLEIPSYEAVAADKTLFAEAFRLASREQNPFSARTIVQRHGDRLLISCPPALPLSEAEMDAIYALPFEKAPHPSYREPIPAWDQIKTSITSHRGCFGGCAFCTIAMHQGKTIQSRSEDSIVAEVRELTDKSWFRGSISDVGGPTANMYGLFCGSAEANRVCHRSSCLFPSICRHLASNDRRAVGMLRKVRGVEGVKHVAVSSGVRYDLMERQEAYFQELVGHHVSGLLKVAPEHFAEHVTALMHKPGRKAFEAFLRRFRDESDRTGKRQQIVPYLISGHPGCTLSDMLELALALKALGFRVEQVQDFTPTPGSLSTCMYHTGIDPDSGTAVYVPRSDREKGLQKALLLWHQPGERNKVLEALRELGKEELVSDLFGVGCGVHHEKKGSAAEKRGTSQRTATKKRR